MSEASNTPSELLYNACEQALLLLERKRFEDDPEAKVVRAVLRGALKQAGHPDPWEIESRV